MAGERPRVAVLDDSQEVARASADWTGLERRAEVTIFRDPFAGEDDVAERLASFDIILPMRERTPFPGSLIRRLPRLRLVALTGPRAPTLDIEACTAAGIVVCNTGGPTLASTAELAFGLILASARAIPSADAAMRQGGWHGGVPIGAVLAGSRLGLVGLGRIGSRVAGYGRAFGMETVAWSPNLTLERAAAEGATLVGKEELFATADVVSLHLVLSERSRGVVGAPELAAMKPGAILVNTARGPLVDEPALLAALTAGAIRAGLDVFDREPLPAAHPLRALPNVVLTPHLGYATAPIFAQFYAESIENILAFLDGAPIRVFNPDVIARGV